MAIHFWHKSVSATLAAGCMLLVVITSAQAQLKRDAPGFWGLRPGNEFTVIVASSRRTEISVDGNPEVVRESSESQRIQYRVVAIDRSGDITIKAIIQTMERTPSSQLLTRLSGATFMLSVEPDGRVKTLSAEGRDALVTYLSNGDPESAAILRKCVNDETIASWFSGPFWLIPPAEEVDDKTWEHEHVLSLGTMGTIHAALQFRPAETKDGFTTVKLDGNARFQPLVLPDTADRTPFPTWRNTTVEIKSLTGTARMATPPPGNEEIIRRRPTFESLEWTVQVQGKGALPLTGEEKEAEGTDSEDGTSADPSADDLTNVSFKMTQNHVWTLQSHVIGYHNEFDNGRILVPVR